MRVALVMWPDTFEDWYRPLGIDRETYLNGYDGEWTISFTGALVASGHEVHVVHGSRTGAPSAVQHPSGATTHFVKAPWLYRAFVQAAWGKGGWEPLQKVWGAAPATAALSARLVRGVRSLRPDAVILQDYEALRYDVLAPLLRAAGLRVVGLDTGGSARPSSARPHRAALRLAHRLMPIHEAEATRLRGLGLRRVEVWPVPVRTDVFVPRDRDEARQALGLAPDEPVVFSAGRLHPVKELPTLARVCAELDVTLVLSGDGPERARLEARRDPKLRLLGRVPIEDVARWYAACNVAALASRQEGQPVAVLEALACGRGVVATRVGGTPEVLGDDVTGWSVKARDAGDLKAKLAQALADQPEADRRGARGRELVLARHTPEQVAAWFTARLAR